MKKLNLSDKLQLPAEETVESAIGVIGKRGRGKSGAVKVLMEELVLAELPFVAFDPVGIMWGLRSSADGKKPSGANVLVVGGSHGDVKLDRRAGAEVARAIVQANVSAIIDFSEEPKASYREFVRDFSNEIYRVNDTSRVIIIEEAPELVPQRLRPDMTQVFDAVERLVSRGRNRGLGVVLVSQRAATINKDVLTQVDAMMVFGLTSPQDRAALKDWVEAKAEPARLAEFVDGLAGLQRQEAWFWAPEAFGGIFRKVKFRDFSTLHPDKTHLRRAGLLQVKPVTTDVSTIVDKLGAAVAKLGKEKTAVADTKKLEAQLAKAQAEIERLKARPAPVAASKVGVKTVEVSILKDKHLHRTEQLIARAEKAAQGLGAIAKQLSFDAGRLTQALKGANRQGSVAGRMSIRPAVAPPRSPALRAPLNPDKLLTTQGLVKVAAHVAANSPDGEPNLRSGERRMLQTLAQRHHLKMTRAQLGTLAGFTPSGGTFSTYYGTLKRFGFLQENGGGLVQVTQEGLDFLGADVPPAPASTEELQAMWKEMLRAGEAKMLDQLIRDYPNGLTREQLGIATEFEHTGGTFSTYLGTLRRNGLVVEQDGELRASETLFIDGA